MIGLLVSVALTLMLLAWTSIPPVEDALIGLIGSVIGLLAEVYYQTERIADDMAIERGLGPHAAQMREMAGLARDIRVAFAGSIPEHELRRHLDQFTDELQQLRDGRVRSHGNDYRLLIDEMLRAQAAVEAVTNVPSRGTAPRRDASWWDSDVGRRYWEANLAALARGVRIRRVFIVDSLRAGDPKLVQLMSAQQAAGVDVRFAERAQVEPAAHLNIAIWDHIRAWEARTNAQLVQYENTLTYSPADVERLRRCFALADIASSAFSPQAISR